jgi:hypothetical protein
VDQKNTKIGEIGDVISDYSITSNRAGKWTAVFNWLCQISLNAASNGAHSAV